jgi:micrococcal nuclease
MLEWLKIVLLASSVHVQIVDGDTVRTNDGGPNVRLTGYNAPEVYQPRCVNEKALGEAAKARLHALVKQGAALSISSGACGYGRRCGTMTLNGRNVGDILVSEGLAEPMVCTAGKCPPARNWCGG